MKRLKLFIWVLLVSGFTALQAQAVSGTVTDDAGEPLIGATILVDGTTTGTVTDIDGNFSLDVPANAETATISYTGFASQKIDLTSGQTNFAIVMQTDAIGLEDVVVIGYAPVKRKDLTGSVSSVSGEALNREAGATLQSGLRQAAGVVVQQSSGAPGAGYNIRVRGATSITASNEPLFVVDGIPIIAGSFTQQGIGGQQTNALADINPNDIESIEVLKDASTTAIYGSRAANGVVLITTKRGNTGRTKINYNTTFGFNEPIRLIDVVDGAGYTDYIEERYGFRNVSLFSSQLDTLNSNDWQDIIFNSNPIQNHNLSMSGGDAKTKYFTSLNYDDNQGILENSRFRRYNARINLDHSVSDKVLTTVNMSFNHTNNQQIQNDNNIFGAVSTAILLPPAANLRNEDGTYGSAFGLENPVAATEEYDNKVLTNRFIGNASLSYLPTEWLTLRATLGVDNFDLREQIFEPSLLQSSPAGIITESTTRNTRLLNEYTATINQSFGSTNLVAVVGAVYQRDNRRRNFLIINNVPDNAPSADAGAAPQTIAGDLLGDILSSYIASVNVNIGGNLFLTGSFRADGSSRFINDRWGYFPGVAIAYDFADNIKGFDQLKIRASYGQTGNNNVGDFATRDLFNAQAFVATPGTFPGQIGSPDLVWETTTTTDIGLDFAILDSKISAQLGYFIKNTDDLILNRPLPTTSGFPGVLENIGEMRNSGFEATLTFAPYQGEFSWTTSITAAYLENEVVNVFNDQPFDRGFATRVAEGQPLGAFFGFETDGIFQNQAEIEAGPMPAGLNVAPGDLRFVDQNGDGVINDDDRTFIGKALPDWTGGIQNNFSYKGFDLSFFFQFSLGNDVFNNNLAFAEGLNSVFAPTVRSFENAWREEGDGNRFPRVTGGQGAINNRRDSDQYLEDGSFVRLKNAQLAYNFPASMFGDKGVRSLKVFIQGTNLITWTDYSWYDPEVNTFGDDGVALGTDFLTYPQARTLQFGINLGL